MVSFHISPLIKDHENAKNSFKMENLKIAAAVILYWCVSTSSKVSISLVFINKYLLANAEIKVDAPLFVTWVQCLCTVFLCLFFGFMSRKFKFISFPSTHIDYNILKQILPLSLVFVGMITFNNLCLKYVGVAFYYIGRSLTTVFNVIFTFVILGQTTSIRALVCCGFIVGGFFLGVDQEDASGTLSLAGVVFGVLASACVSLNAIYTKKFLPHVDNSIWRLALYNNINAIIIFLPLMLLNGEIGLATQELWAINPLTNSQWPVVYRFWGLLMVSGVLGFAMGYVTGLQIQVTSPLTHNISGTAKAAFQTVLAVVWYEDYKHWLWWLSNATVLSASGAYTWVKRQEMKTEFLAKSAQKSPSPDSIVTLESKPDSRDESDSEKNTFSS